MRRCTLTRSRLKFIAIVLLFLTVIFITILFSVPDSPAQSYLMDVMYWLDHIPLLWGSLTLTIIYAISLIFCFPGTPINLAAGYMFGFWIGSFVTVIGCDIGATLSFLLGRTLGKDWAQKQIAKNPKFQLVNLAVEKNAWLIIFLVRLSPVFPFGICNYLFGVTKASFWTYWSATTAGLLPCTMAYTYLGSLMRDLSEIYSEGGADTTQRTVIIAIALVITVGGIAVITIITKRSLEKAMKEQEIELRTATDIEMTEQNQPLVEPERGLFLEEGERERNLFSEGETPRGLFMEGESTHGLFSNDPLLEPEPQTV